MSCTSSATGSQQPSSAGLTTSIPKTSVRREGEGGCSECNSQLWSSYVVGLLACFLVVGGIFLAFHRWDYLWLAVSAVGVVLILIGASLHYCGGGVERRAAANAGDGNAAASVQKRKRGSNHHRTVEPGNQNERLLPSNATTGLGSGGHNLSVSQLSLNMLPPFFPSYDTVSLGTQVPGSPMTSPTVSPIMHLNGQSFLLLPIGGATTTETSSDTNSLVRRLSTHLAVLEQQSLSHKRCPEAVNFGLVPSISSFSSCDPNSSAVTVSQSVTAALADTTVQTTTDNQDCQANVQEALGAMDESQEPIYQVPRSPSTPVDIAFSQNDLNTSHPSTTELNNLGSNTLLDDALTQVMVEDAIPENETLPNCEESNTSIQVDALSSHHSVIREDVSHVSLPVDSARNSSNEASPEVCSENPVSSTFQTVQQEQQENNRPQHSDSENVATLLDLRVSTPEPDWTLPPSYEEVAPPCFKQLGHHKFAYETL